MVECFDANQVLLNVHWGLLFKCSKIGFGTAMEFGDTWQNVMAVRGDVQEINPIYISVRDAF